MGLTDRQFSGYLRMLIARLKDVQEQKDPEKKNERLQEILADLQSSLED